MAVHVSERELGRLLVKLPGATSRDQPSRAATRLANALVNHAHLFSSQPTWQDDDPAVRLQKGLVAVLTFDLHYQQFKADAIDPETEQKKYVFRLVMEAAGVQEAHVTASDVCTAISQLRLFRRQWVLDDAQATAQMAQTPLKTLLQALDRSIIVCDRVRRRAHHDVGRLPMPFEKDWPRHLATRMLQAREIQEDTENHMAQLLRVRSTDEQIHRGVQVFFQAYDSLSEALANEVKGKLTDLSGKLPTPLRFVTLPSVANESVSRRCCGCMPPRRQGFGRRSHNDRGRNADDAVEGIIRRRVRYFPAQGHDSQVWPGYEAPEVKVCPGGNQ